MNLKELAIRAVIDDRLNGKYGLLSKQMVRGRDPYEDDMLRQLATEKVNSMSNIELLELVTPLLAEGLKGSA